VRLWCAGTIWSSDRAPHLPAGRAGSVPVRADAQARQTLHAPRHRVRLTRTPAGRLRVERRPSHRCGPRDQRRAAAGYLIYHTPGARPGILGSSFPSSSGLGVLFLLYFLFGWAALGRTVGMGVMGLKV
jgi:hypothetical protein